MATEAGPMIATDKATTLLAWCERTHVEGVVLLSEATRISGLSGDEVKAIAGGAYRFAGTAWTGPKRGRPRKGGARR